MEIAQDWRDTRPRYPTHDPDARRRVLNFVAHLATRAGTDAPWTVGHALDAAAKENA